MGHRALTAQDGDMWRTQHAYSTVFYGPTDYDDGNTLRNIEERIDRLTMIGPHKDEANIMFTRQLPGAMPGTDLDNQALRNVHHDRNQRENRAATVIVYLSTAGEDDGGHTLFPCLPRQVAGGDPPSASAQQLADGLAATLRGLYENGTRIIKAEGPHPGGSSFDTINECNRQCAMVSHSQVLSIRPKRGMAVVIWHVHPDGSPNHAAVRIISESLFRLVLVLTCPTRLRVLLTRVLMVEVLSLIAPYVCTWPCICSGMQRVRLSVVMSASPFKNSRKLHAYPGSWC
eukprot:COSAG02_NODE_5030_length_4715_cov_3.115035_5_plen_287_part_00